MGTVFGKAQRTIAWLGKASSTTDEAMEFLVTLRKTEKPRIDFRYRDLRRMHPELNVPAKWKSLEHLFSLPWWTRGWTLQELMIPDDLVFYCGDKSISIVSLSIALSTIWCSNPSSDLIKPSIWRRPWTRLRLVKWYWLEPWREKMSLIALLAYSGDCDVTDPRDRMYSLLGVSRKADRELVGRADYSCDIVTGYTKLVKRFIEEHKSLDIICLAHVFHARNHDDQEGDRVPSWVPNWRIRVAPFVTPTMVSQASKNLMPAFAPGGPAIRGDTAAYAASGALLPRASFSEDLTKMTCKGLMIDRIDGLGPSNADRNVIEQPEQGLVQSTSKKNEQFSLEYGPEGNSGLVDVIIRCLMLDRKDRYLTYPVSPHMEELRRELHAALVTTVESQDEGMLQQFRSWLKANEQPRLRGTTLQETFNILDGPLFKSDGIGRTTSVEEEIVHKPMSRLPRETEIGSSDGARDNRDNSVAFINIGEGGFLSRFRDTTAPHAMARRLITTTKGHVGMGPLLAKKDDVVCILFGCSVPVVLRRVIEPGPCYEFVGECYLDGFMNGEAIRQWSRTAGCISSEIEKNMQDRPGGVSEVGLTLV